MFHDISDPILSRMRYLEEVDARDRQDGTPRSRRMRQIPPETGRFIALAAASTPPGAMLEVGTSAGYSALWISLACDRLRRTLTTIDNDPFKTQLASETFRLAGVEDFVHPVEGDARQLLPRYQEIAFCFLDTDKRLYQECYDIVVPKLVSGGMLLVDNAVSHADSLTSFLQYVEEDARVDSIVISIGKGVLLCRKL
ncbi:MAG: O-methyltransferase [Candidatus Promineifilaceae bacterium]|jgi:predicted O-methyltransferase YrrM